MKYNVFYLKDGDLYRYCTSPMDRETAQKYCDKFNAKYPGKPYPNGKGFYRCSKAWVAHHECALAIS